MSDRPDAWMPMFWGDYLKDTGHLSTEEHGAYMLLIGQYWTTGKPLPAEDARLAQIARLPIAKWRKMAGTIAAFFQMDGSTWRHKRIDLEIADAQARKDKKHKAGKAGAAARYGRGTAVATTVASADASSNRSADGTSRDHATGIADTIAKRCPPPSPSPLPLPSEAAAAARPGPEPEPKPVNPEVKRRRDIGERVIEICGGDPMKLTLDYGPVSAWLAAGYDPELDIFPTVERMSKRPGFRLKTFNYFTEAIGETWQGRQPGAKPSRPNSGPGERPQHVRTPGKTAFQVALEAWIAGGRQGPRPDPADHPGEAA